MHSSLDRILNIVLGSPYYKSVTNGIPSSQLNWLTEQKCTKAYTFENLNSDWQKFLGACLYSADISNINSKIEVPIYSGLTKQQIKIINSNLKEGSITLGELITDEDIALLPVNEKKVVNQERFPDVNFLKSNEFYQIGTIGSTSLLLVGREQGNNAPIVAKSYTLETDVEELFAVPLYTLLNSQESINITEEI